MGLIYSVIIPALNEEYLLPRLLTALKEQTFKNFEVILVDANSTDKTVEEAKKYTSFFPLSIIHTSERNISRSRNIGAQKAKGQYFVFIDADNCIHPAFLKNMHMLLEKKPYEMIVPAVQPDSKKAFYKMTYSSVNFLVWIGKKFGLAFSTGGNFIIKKEVFEKLKGFDETIFVGEDHDIVYRAHKKGLKIAFVRNPKVVFSVRRLEKEGAGVFFKYFVSTVYIAFFGKITKKIYNYEMGGDYYKKEN